MKDNLKDQSGIAPQGEIITWTSQLRADLRSLGINVGVVLGGALISSSGGTIGEPVVRVAGLLVVGVGVAGILTRWESASKCVDQIEGKIVGNIPDKTDISE